MIDIYRSHIALAMVGLGMVTVALFMACLLMGSVEIPAAKVLDILAGGGNPVERVIVLGTRVPMACTAVITGAALAVAGLMLQTTFDNPLAGPSILGVSTGASLGVAVVLLALGGVLGAVGRYFAILIGAFGGAAVVLLLLLGFSRLVRSSAMLLIVGIMVGYLASSAVSLLNFFSTQEGVHSFVIWGMGSFSGVTNDRLLVYFLVSAVLLAFSFLMVKPLDAMLLGERYASNLGVNIVQARNILLLLSGGLTAAATAFCGPIGFIGLIVPHIARLCVGTSRHGVLMPATALTGAGVALLCVWLSVLPSTGAIPINAITPIIGVPVIIYIILSRHE